MLTKLLVACLLAQLSFQITEGTVADATQLPGTKFRNLKGGAPTSKIPEKGGKFGFIKVNSGNGDLYYMLFPPRNTVANTPLIIWLSGGPGCSSAFSSIYENGPMFIDKDGNAQPNPYSWNDKAWTLYIDQPLGTGYGHSSQRDIPELEDEVADKFFTFLKTFYDLHPELKPLRLFIGGFSYGGHYVPAIANKLYFYNNNFFNLQGIMIGNGWTSPATQQSSYIDFAAKYDLTKDDPTLLNKLRPLFKICENGAALNPIAGKNIQVDFCLNLFELLSTDPKTGKKRWSVYNFNEPCYGPSCVDAGKEVAWLNDPLVQKELGVDTPIVIWSDYVYKKMIRMDFLTDAGLYLTDLLNSGLKVLAYNGDVDVICNYMSGEVWTNNLKWKNQEAFKAAPYTDAVLPNKTVYGKVKTVDNLSYMTINQAGHFVPHDKPAEALFMINQFAGLE